MKDSILIHHDNVPYIDIFDKEIYFESSDDVDRYISEKIIKEIADSSCKIIYIKDNLSSNYMELYGIRVAYHIRLSQELKEKRYLPIVILSELDGYLLGKLNKEANILFSKNIFVLENKKEIVEAFEIKHQNLTEDEYKDSFLDLIDIDAPNEYESHHDISNKWAIYRWADALGLKSEIIEKNSSHIESLLYFKYLKSRQISQTDATTPYSPQTLDKKGKILYIDDEYRDGWADILNELFNSSSKIVFEPLEYDYKDQHKFTMLTDLKELITQKMPDIVILDLRFTKSDHEKQSDISNYTGIKINKLIKEINPGIQTIIMSATSQSLIVEKLYKEGVLGYIKKEHPNDISLDTTKSIDKLLSLVDNGLERSYLKDVWKIQEEILQKENKEELQELKIVLGRVFDILNSDIADKEVFSGLTIFKCIEIIIGFYIEERSSRGTNGKMVFEKYWKGSDEKIAVNSIQDKIEAIFDSKFKTTYKSISKDMKAIVVFRNNTIHGGRDHAIKKPTSQNLITWLKILQKIITQMDKLS